MSKLNFKIDNKTKQITCTGSYLDLLKDIEEYKQHKKTPKTSDNESKLRKFITDTDKDHVSFSGGLYEDITNMKNLNSFKKTLAEFSKNKLQEKIQAKLDFTPKRKRSSSEHDGDYDLDKRWEIKPFTNSHKEMLPINVVDVNVDMSISASMKAEDINKYGALVWSIIQIVESLGIQANVNIINESVGTSTNGYASTIVLKIKRAGEYISPVALTSCFQSVFYRRAIFGAIVLSCDEFKFDVDYGLGRPKHTSTDKNIWFENGAIYTRPGGQFKIEEVERAITKMVKGEK